MGTGHRSGGLAGRGQSRGDGTHGRVRGEILFLHGKESLRAQERLPVQAKAGEKGAFLPQHLPAQRAALLCGMREPDAPPMVMEREGVLVVREKGEAGAGCLPGREGACGSGGHMGI